jgi:hypothetical protein
MWRQIKQEHSPNQLLFDFNPNFSASSNCGRTLKIKFHENQVTYSQVDTFSQRAMQGEADICTVANFHSEHIKQSILLRNTIN